VSGIIVNKVEHHELLPFVFYPDLQKQGEEYTSPGGHQKGDSLGTAALELEITVTGLGRRPLIGR
jgi:hypothetical protein